MKKGYVSGKYYVITATIKNGDKWETRRNTFQGMESVIQDVLADKEVKNFTVEEKFC